MSDQQEALRASIANANIGLNARREILMARLTQFTALASMGAYKVTDDTRILAQADLDLFLDATIDFHRRVREAGGVD